MTLALEGKITLILSFILIASSTLLGHNPNEAFFTVNVADNNTTIIAELPWSIRNDLIITYPELSASKSDQDFRDLFQKYIQRKLILKNRNGKTLPLVSVTEVKHNGHSHQNNYNIVFSGTDVFKIENTILFGSYENQKNYHYLYQDQEKQTFITTVHQSSFVVDDEPVTPYNNVKYWLVVLLIVLPSLIYYFFKKKSTN